ncbi:MAG: patatin family protein [Acidobacteria bacterium]|nr:patatin family protein [Acidobacteriota bacterium]
MTLSELLEASKVIRSGRKEDPDKAFQIARQIAGLQSFEEARLLAIHLIEARTEPSDPTKLRQQLALWTSKNPDAPDDSKHDDALEILDRIRFVESGAPLATTTVAETLGIAGGICKRKWFVDGRRETLERSLAYYERGAQQGIELDQGYTAINAAFVHDLLAVEASDAELHRESARKLRSDIVAKLQATQDTPAWKDGPPWKEVRWFQETLAEAHFGLGGYASAKRHLEIAYEKPVEPWEYETTARQFAWLARLQAPEVQTSAEFAKSEPWGVLRAVYGERASNAAASLFAGKLGLALSGGGFRASFFHIGVLAALAERDMLRHVEALSCVSGGSIVGAHYYLEIRKLLQEKADGEITRDEYVQVVERVAEAFLAGVQKNIRMRVVGSVVGNLRMMFQPGYTRTNRLGELYEEHLYARIGDDGKRSLRELIIRPKGDETCKPKYDNWKRTDKVPILILNAASENTGHSWQFTATWMGEPPSRIDSEVDGNYRLRRMYYEEAPPRHQDVRLGQAVAASSCVPGLFPPLELQGLYDGIVVRLVDGGVHDNQGLYGLLDQNCTVMIVSDASGQMSTIDRPPDDPLGVLLRTSSVLQSRVRTAQYREMESRRKAGLLKGLLFLHLKKDLEAEPRDWKGCRNPREMTGAESLRRRQTLTTYGVRKDLQESLANIRTDLDSFSEVEAFALMASGHNMVRTGFADAIQGFPVYQGEHPWRFLRMASALQGQGPEDLDALSKLLNVGSSIAFKIWRLSGALRAINAIGGVIALAAVGWAAYTWRSEPLLTPKGLAGAAALALVSLALTRLGLTWIVQAVQYRKTVYQMATGAALCLVGWAAAGVHLLLFDRWFLARGKVDALKRGAR